MPTAKYFGQPVDNNGHRQFWPGTIDGYPLKGSVAPPMLKQEEYEQIPHQYDYRVEQLCLPADMRRYQEIKDRIVNGYWLRDYEERHYNEADKTYSVMISWIEPYGVVPPPGYHSHEHETVNANRPMR